MAGSGVAFWRSGPQQKKKAFLEHSTTLLPGQFWDKPTDEGKKTEKQINLE